MENFENEINNCTTTKQVQKVLKKYGRKIIVDQTEDFGVFNVWISETERIYKPYKSKHMKYQKWKKVQFVYSGIPTFF